MIKKTELACHYWDVLNIKGVLRISSEFRLGITEAERKQLKLGYECIVHPDFYKQLGKNPSVEINKALKIFHKKIYLPYKEQTA